MLGKELGDMDSQEVRVVPGRSDVWADGWQVKSGEDKGATQNFLEREAA